MARLLQSIYEELAARLEFDLGSREAAQDALQDSWIRLSVGPAIGPVRNPRAYIRRMAHNLGRNRLRGTARYSLMASSMVAGLADPAPDPERIAADRRDLAVVFEAIAELPEQRRTIFLDRFRDDLSLDEIARLRKLHRRTVQKELHRVSQFLRERLQRES